MLINDNYYIILLLLSIVKLVFCKCDHVTCYFCYFCYRPLFLPDTRFLRQKNACVDALPTSFEWVLCLIQTKTSCFFEKNIRLCNKKQLLFCVARLCCPYCVARVALLCCSDNRMFLSVYRLAEDGSLL